jgi:hypothetical protein
MCKHRELTLLFLVALAPLACRALEPNVSPISTDRPGLLYSSSVVPRGAWQMELGLPFVQVDRSGGSETSLIAAGAQLRYGLSEKLELRVGGVPAAWQRVESNGDSHSDWGASDLEIGAKYALPTESASVLLANVRLPTGSGEFTAHEHAYSLYAISEVALDDSHSLKGLVGWTGQNSSASHWTDTASLGVLLNHAFSPRFSGYVEAASYPDLRGGNAPTYVGVGVALLLSSNVQLDAAVDFGANDDAVDALFGTGVSMRW